jgi:hypothetical protein
VKFDVLYQPFVSWPIWWIALLAGLALVALQIFKRRRGGVLRLLTLGLLLAALANPILSFDQREKLNDVALLLIDKSASQMVGKRSQQTADMAADIQKKIAAVGETELRVVNVTSGNTAETDGTRLFSALEQARNEIPAERYAGAIMLTDGQVHDVPEKPGTLGPINAVISGSRKEFDRRIVITRVPRFAIAGHEQVLTYKVEDGGPNAASVDVAITLADGETRTEAVKPGAETELPFTLPHAGRNFIELSVPPEPGEVSTSNNRTIATIEGIRDRLRVLLISGEPNPGERTWRNLLKADAAVDLVHFTILRPPEKQDGTPTKELSLIAFPTRELFIDKLDQFDLVIFDRYERQAILPDDYMANVADYVRKGGAVLLTSGPDFAAEDGLASSPLSSVLAVSPTGEVTEQAFRPQVTEAGRKHPVTAHLPGGDGAEPTWGHWFRLIDTVSEPDVQPLMSGPDGKALLVLSHAGEGRVAQLLSDHGWLWARGYDGGGPQIELLRRIAHWLMKEPELEEEALRAHQHGGDLVIERRTMADKAEPVTVTKPDGSAATVPLTQKEPGVFSGIIAAPDAGMYKLGNGTLSAVAAIGIADPLETRDLRATADVVKPAVAATGGAINWMEDGAVRIVKVRAGAAAGGNGWLGLRDNQQFRTIAVRETSLFTTLLSLAALLIAVVGLWLREGR